MSIPEVEGASREAVNHPAHYAAHYRREVIELTSHMDFSTGNAVKYVLRCRFKANEKEDLQKARWYLDYFTGHPQCGFLREGGDLDDVIADFLADLASDPDRGFAAGAGGFLRSVITALRLPVGDRGASLGSAARRLEELSSRA